jgi:hypothetical protein
MYILFQVFLEVKVEAEPMNTTPFYKYDPVQIASFDAF